jgi:REP element-mobilizing transposase RayT
VGNRQERVFHDEADRLLFYQTLGEARERTGWRVHAWVLMSNHYHLMVETPEANLVGGNEMAAEHLYAADLLTDPYLLSRSS